MRHSLARQSVRNLLLGCAAALAGAVAMAPSTARACSCMQQTPQQAFDQAAAVFEGHVLSVQPKPGEPDAPVTHEVRLKVVRAWKDAAHEELTVTTPGDSAACGYGFGAGRSYLVYAVAQDGGLAVSLCGRTQPLDQAAEDLKLLGMGSTPVDPKAPGPLPDDATQDKAAADDQPPAQGGCAGCSVGAAREAAPGSVLLLLALLALATCRGRSRSRT